MRVTTKDLLKVASCHGKLWAKWRGLLEVAPWQPIPLWQTVFMRLTWRGVTRGSSLTVLYVMANDACEIKMKRTYWKWHLGGLLGQCKRCLRGKPEEVTWSGPLTIYSVMASGVDAVRMKSSYSKLYYDGLFLMATNVFVVNMKRSYSKWHLDSLEEELLHVATLCVYFA